MSPLAEALALPALFLTVTLTGGVRLGDTLAFDPPSLFAMVLSMLLVAGLVQSGTVAPERLLGDSRTALANLNGLSVLLTMFAASSQVLSLITPGSGVPALMVSLLLLVMLVQMLAISLDRTRLLRGLMVTIAAAFTLKFVVLAGLSEPAGGRALRALQVLFDNVTLGAIAQPPLARADGYLAFGTLILYLLGLSLLPAAPWRTVRVEGAAMLPAGPSQGRLSE